MALQKTLSHPEPRLIQVNKHVGKNLGNGSDADDLVERILETRIQGVALSYHLEVGRSEAFIKIHQAFRSRVEIGHFSRRLSRHCLHVEN